MKTLSRSPFPLQSFFELSLHLFIYPVSARSTRNKKKKKRRRRSFFRGRFISRYYSTGSKKYRSRLLGQEFLLERKIKQNIVYRTWNTRFFIYRAIFVIEKGRELLLLYTQTRNSTRSPYYTQKPFIMDDERCTRCDFRFHGANNGRSQQRPEIQVNRSSRDRLNQPPIPDIWRDKGEFLAGSNYTRAGRAIPASSTFLIIPVDRERTRVEECIADS